MIRYRVQLSLAIGCAALSCSRDPAPAAHVTVWLDTDAPTPRLLDVARVEVFAPDGSLLRGAREVALDEASLKAGLSFTVVPTRNDVSAGIVHVLAWRARDGRAEPRAGESVETWTLLPAVPAAASADVTIVLSLDGVGTPLGSQTAPIPAVIGRSPSRVGPWSGAAVVECPSAPLPGEVCIRGGAYWMGHPRASALGVQSGGDRRLVVLAPFFLDEHEVTVSQYRRDGKVYAGRWSGQYGGSDEKDYCTFTDSPGPNEDMPINCVRWQYARQYCSSRPEGGDVPTEAQIEFVASAFGTSLYPWGDTSPSCSDAVWGRGGASAGVAEIAQLPSTCLPQSGDSRERAGSPEATTRADVGRDFVDLGNGQRVIDLSGNLAEWARDAFALETSECWQPRKPNVFRDPWCQLQSDPTAPAYSYRGAAFYEPILGTASAVRAGAVEGAHLDLGFRCVRPAAGQ